MHAPWKIGFALARKFRALDPDADPNDLIPDIQREIPKGATDAEREAVTAEFVGAWPRVKYPEGFAGPLFDAYRAAMENPPPKAAKGLHSPVARNLLAFCEHLGRNGQFTLAQTAVARVMDVGQPEISRWLRYFRDHNWIRMEVEANHGHRQAAEYEWIADQEEST